MEVKVHISDQDIQKVIERSIKDSHYTMQKRLEEIVNQQIRQQIQEKAEQDIEDILNEEGNFVLLKNIVSKAVESELQIAVKRKVPGWAQNQVKNFLKAVQASTWNVRDPQREDIEDDLL